MRRKGAAKRKGESLLDLAPQEPTKNKEKEDPLLECPATVEDPASVAAVAPGEVEAQAVSPPTRREQERVVVRGDGPDLGDRESVVELRREAPHGADGRCGVLASDKVLALQLVPRARRPGRAVGQGEAKVGESVQPTTRNAALRRARLFQRARSVPVRVRVRVRVGACVRVQTTGLCECCTVVGS